MGHPVYDARGLEVTQQPAMLAALVVVVPLRRITSSGVAVVVVWVGGSEATLTMAGVNTILSTRFLSI